MLEAIKEYPELEERIISPKEAMKRKKESSLLVMVDYHKPSLSISQELYERFDKVVIIDHHRRGDEFPAKPLLSYIESSASSASELVTELIEYQSNSANKLQAFEATMMLAGIVVDTKSFNTRTTARTFDVASYLRTCGADSSLVQYLLSSDLTSYLEMNNLISKSEYVTKDTVVVAGVKTKNMIVSQLPKQRTHYFLWQGLMQHLSLPSGRINRLALVLGVMVQLMSKLLWKI